MASSVLAAFFVLQIIGSQINVVQISGPQINLPSDFNTNFLMLMRWIHFLSRHHLDRAAVFLQPGECAFHEGT
jgi:hypothetical protein